MTNVDLTGLIILIIEDDLMQQKRLAAQLSSLGAEVAIAATLEAGKAKLASETFDFVLLDVNLPDGIGTDLLKQKIFPPDTSVIVLTAHGGVSGAVDAMRFGASDYLIKPVEIGEVPLAIERCRQTRQSARVKEHRREDQTFHTFFFGSALAALETQLNRIIEADRRLGTALPPVLIQGETGTGKTAVARWLHQHGSNSQKELIDINCSSLPDALAESELFGHESGAFTDAKKARMGLFEAANGGTLFLDELPSLSLPIQAKILVAIEDRKIRRVGGNRAIPVDVRIIAATNRDLKALVKEGLFREDLYHRLDLYRISIPPLRDRGADILKLAEFFAGRLCQKHRLPERTISSAGRERLLSYHWPGNVRELSHELERAIVFEDRQELDFANLPMPGNSSTQTQKHPWLEPSFRFPDSGFSLEAAIDTMVQMAMDQAEGNASAAGRLLGMPRDFVRYRMKQITQKNGGN